MISRVTNKTLSFFASAVLACLIAPTNAHAQNLLVDGGFDGAPQTQHGDRFDEDLSPWMFATVSPTAVIQNTQNLVAVDGPGGFDYQDRGPESDASSAPAGVTQYYIDSGNIPLYGWQYFTPSCRGTATASMKVTNREGHGEAGPTLTGAEVPPQAGPFTFRSTQGGLAILQVPNQIPTFPIGFGVSPAPTAQLVTALKAQFDAEKMPFLLTAATTQTYPWTPMTFQAPVEAGQLYAFMAELGHSVNMDNASVEVACDTPVVPVPTDITVTKTCDAPVAGVHNGVSGMFWDCEIDAQGTLHTQPSQGVLHVNDLVTPSTGTTAEIISMTSQSGNMNCTYNNGQSCLVAGNTFDATNGETIDVQLFLSGAAAPAQHNVENCVKAIYFKNGQPTQFPQSCVTTQWEIPTPSPYLNTVKTCDPIAPVSTGPMTLNCQIQVTGTNLAPGSFVLVGDAFAGLPPMNASIIGTMMNVTSNEPWSCVDLNINTPSSVGLCELPAADMAAAGGSSVINVSFEFTTDQSGGQVANCPISEATPNSFISATGQRSSQPPMRSPQTDSVQLPDGCVLLDIPPAIVEEKIERAEMTKSCDQPQQAVVNGVLGYTWDCQATITVIPIPFAGTFTLDDDASNISIGVAQFLSASEPNCQGIGTDQLSCALNGATMTAPHIVTYQLFTELTDPNQPIEWENCIKGRAETTADEHPTVPMCVGRVIKPEISVVDPEPKEITLTKKCGRPSDAQQNGVNGKRWSCEVTVTANPAPFSGTFSFLEDASNVSGTTSANIIGYQSTNAGWTCGGTFPQPQTQCGILGNVFSQSGVETISFDLFAANQGNSVKWENCVSGTYTNAFGEKRDVKGNCVGTDWENTKEPPVIPLKKGCRATGTENGNSYYLCSIYVSPPSSGTVTGPLTVDELFTTASGASATQYIQALIGTPSAPNGWACQQPNFPNGASCTISAADFNGNTGHRIDAQIMIPTAVLQKEGFENCAQVRIGDQIVGSADCVDIIVETEKVEFDVEKSCKPSGDRQILGATGWVQAYQCTLTVTTNGVPFTDPLWITEDLHFGTNSGAGQIQNITSADPWSCSNPPYSAPGQGNVPYCGIQGAQFPASGTSTLTVDLMMNAAMDQFGAENCVSLSVGPPTANGLPAPIASDCFEFAPAPEPTLDITKTCEPAILGAGNLWTVECTVTVSGTNLPSGHQIILKDGLQGAGSTVINSGGFNPSPFLPQSCTGYAIASGLGSQCILTSDQITANGGSISLPYTGTLSGNRLGLNSPPAENCAAASVSALNLTAPQNATGQACVDIPLTVTAVPGTGGISIDPSIPIIVTPPTGCGFDTLFVIDQSGSMQQQNRMGLTKQAVTAALRIFVGGGSKSGAIVFNEFAYPAGGTSVLLPSSTLETAISAITAGGPTNWVAGMTTANNVVSGLANKPLVLFITDGLPNRPVGDPTQVGNTTYYINQAAPAVNALRAQGSQVVGIALGNGVLSSNLSMLLGPNVVTAGGNVAIDPQTTDVIAIPTGNMIIPAFEAIVNAYCPGRKTMTQPQKDALMATLQAMPKSAGVYMGDDELLVVPEEEAVDKPPVLPTTAPALTTIKEQTGPCVANRASQTYDCGFRLSVTNTGTGPYIGPLVMTDTAGNPGINSASAVSGNGWSCGAAVGNAVSCTNPAVNLTPGASTHVDLRMKVKGLRKGGSLQNCATTGVTDDRRQRVALIQKIMNDRGLKAGPVDGDPGRKTFAALATLRADLGLAESREFDDALFNALGLPLQNAEQASCVTADLAPMPAPPLQCNPKTTVAQGESCACRYDNMKRRNARSCQCRAGYALVVGKGCVEKAAPKPQPVPKTGPKCDLRSTYLRGDVCACIDRKNARNISKTRCGCTNGLPMVNGRCIPIKVRPKPEGDGPAGTKDCRIKIGNVCVK